jgi:hypothetical protein
MGTILIFFWSVFFELNSKEFVTFCSRYVVKDVETFFPIYARLLKKTEPFHVRLFAAQSFAFVFRKVPDRARFLAFLRAELRADEDVS